MDSSKDRSHSRSRALGQILDAKVLARSCGKEDAIVLTALRLAGWKRTKRLRKRHEALLFERMRIKKEMENIWKGFAKSKGNLDVGKILSIEQVCKSVHRSV